jgi:hypothetical protein
MTTLFFRKESEYDILDESGERITSEQLADRYFANPEVCFKMGFEATNFLFFMTTICIVI